MATDAEITEFFREQCNRLAHGTCCTRSCVIRGGNKGYQYSTCVAYEIRNMIHSKLAVVRDTARKD